MQASLGLMFERKEERFIITTNGRRTHQRTTSFPGSLLSASLVRPREAEKRYPGNGVDQGVVNSQGDIHRYASSSLAKIPSWSSPCLVSRVRYVSLEKSGKQLAGVLIVTRLSNPRGVPEDEAGRSLCAHGSATGTKYSVPRAKSSPQLRSLS